MGDAEVGRWLDETDEKALVLHFADDHHAFHEDAKPGDRAGQLGTRALSSSNQLVTMKMRSSTPDLLASWKTKDSIAQRQHRGTELGFVRADVDADIVAGLLMDRVFNQARYVDAHEVYFDVSTLDPDYRAHWVQATLQIVFNGINPPRQPA